MEKLEKHIKQKLEAREIKPSKKAWSKLEKRLETAPEQNNNRKWYMIAAAFIGVLIVTSIYFSGNKEQQQPQIVVKDNQDEENSQASKEAIEIIKEKPSVVETEEQSPKQSDEKQFVEPETKTAVALSEIVEKRIPLENELAENQQWLIDQKVDEVLAKVILLENNNQSVTEAEVDSLLRAAQKEVLTDKLFNQNGSVDAMMLLAEVEDELNDSFRDQIFDALKDGYTKLRTAVVYRNN
ncbi:hypothetical protein [Allomuricauda sp. d1]|uniref:hypothetical protein n=1 Tax=Allomuricauda sp. d1 TaxID=3136725 RepID=UPI0031CE1388